MDRTYDGDVESLSSERGDTLSSEKGYPLFLLNSAEDGKAGASSNNRMSSTSALQDAESRLVLRLVTVKIRVKGLVHGRKGHFCCVFDGRRRNVFRTP